MRGFASTWRRTAQGAKRRYRSRLVISGSAAPEPQETKNRYHTMHTKEIVQPGGSWAEQKRKNVTCQAIIRAQTGGRQKTEPGHSKKRGEIEEENAREEARERGRGGHRQRRPLAQAGACDGARKWGGGGAAQPQRNLECGGLGKKLTALRGGKFLPRQRSSGRVVFHGSGADYFWASRPWVLL